MKLTLSPWVIIVIGFTFGIIPLAFGYFVHYAPNMAEAHMVRDNFQKLESESRKQKQVEDRVNKTIKLVQMYNDEWRQVELQKTLPGSLAAGGINLAKNRYDLTVDVLTFRNSVQKALNAQVKKGGVEVIVGPNVPAMKTDPASEVLKNFNYPDYEFPLVLYNFGVVIVRGTKEQIYANVRSWSTMPNFMAVTHNLVLAGTSPKLVGLYQLEIVGLIRGDKLPGPLPEKTKDSK